MDLKGSVNRGNNLMTVAFLGTLALGLVGEVIMEKDVIDKFDDAFIIIFALIAVIWYFTKDNKYSSSYLPFIMLCGVFVIKIIAFIIEHDDPASVGDEYGLLAPLLAMVIINIVVLRKTKKEATG